MSSRYRAAPTTRRGAEVNPIMQSDNSHHAFGSTHDTKTDTNIVLLDIAIHYCFKHLVIVSVTKSINVDTFKKLQ